MMNVSPPVAVTSPAISPCRPEPTPSEAAAPNPVIAAGLAAVLAAGLSLVPAQRVDLSLPH